MKRISGIHQSLKLILRSVTLHFESLSLLLSLIFNCFQIGFHISLDLGEFNFGSFNSVSVSTFSSLIESCFIIGSCGNCGRTSRGFCRCICCSISSWCFGSWGFRRRVSCLSSCLGSWSFFCWCFLSWCLTFGDSLLLIISLSSCIISWSL